MFGWSLKYPCLGWTPNKEDIRWVELGITLYLSSVQGNHSVRSWINSSVKLQVVTCDD